MKKPSLAVKDDDPDSVLGRIHDSLRDDFEPHTARIDQKIKRRTYGGIYDYLRQVYLNNPEGAKSQKWIRSKIYSIRHSANDHTGKPIWGNDGRRLIRRTIDNMRKHHDLRMLVQTLLLVEHGGGLKALFVSNDRDHIECKPYLWKESNRRVLVLRPTQAVEWFHYESQKQRQG